MNGFGNQFSSEALPGALPKGRNAPQQPPYGLYAEQLSCTAFTAPRAENRRSWLYRIHPSVDHRPFSRISDGRLRTAPFSDAEATPAQLRWNPIAFPSAPTDFIDGLFTVGGNGDAAAQSGMAIHLYAVNRSMNDRVFSNADGELLLVPQLGSLRLLTEFGILEIVPGQIALIPRGVRFRVELIGDSARGYACENYGAPFRLPELGPIGANGLANARDFEAPSARYEDVSRPHQHVTKFQGHLWMAEMDHSPLDVVAWHGNVVPLKYDVEHFNAIGSISYDHPDPSLFTVLTSPSDTPGVANCDFVVFPPRWLVGEDTFRPPYFHRNVMSEYMGLVHGAHDAKAEGFIPGGGSLHNCMSPHGPDRVTSEVASSAALKPVKVENSLAFMFETRYAIATTLQAMDSSLLQQNYNDCWQGIAKRFDAELR